MLEVWQHNFLSPLARKVYAEMERCGSITALGAMRSLGITSASLARRICDLEAIGVKITRERGTDPITNRAYTSYKLADAKRNPIAA